MRVAESEKSNFALILNTRYLVQIQPTIYIFTRMYRLYIETITLMESWLRTENMCVERYATLIRQSKYVSVTYLREMSLYVRNEYLGATFP